MKTFEKQIEVRWSDCDANGHVRHSAYYDYGAYVRIRCFAEHGFDTTKLTSLGIGPILFKEECSFIREIRPDDTIRINLLRGNVREDGSRWELHHEIFNQRDEKCAHITIQGAWLDLKLRKLAVPPTEMAKVLNELLQGEAFVYRKSKS